MAFGESCGPCLDCLAGSWAMANHCGGDVAWPCVAGSAWLIRALGAAWAAERAAGSRATRKALATNRLEVMDEESPLAEVAALLPTAASAGVKIAGAHGDPFSQADQASGAVRDSHRAINTTQPAISGTGTLPAGQWTGGWRSLRRPGATGSDRQATAIMLAACNPAGQGRGYWRWATRYLWVSLEYPRMDIRQAQLAFPTSRREP